MRSKNSLGSKKTVNLILLRIIRYSHFPGPERLAFVNFLGFESLKNLQMNY
jgi:hypothetical protein